MMANGRIRPLWPVLVSILLALLVSGCSNSNENSGLTLVDQNGNHPANFLSTHPGYAVAEINQCTQCHGSDLTGGISTQSCFLSACHHDPEPNWVVFPSGPPQGHGSSAKAVPGSSGFVSCQICHAEDFSGGGAQVSCLSAGCHGGPGQSPHPAAWRSGDTYVHTSTAEENASVCAQCHLDGANSPIGPPSPPAPAGTPPGCFNSTLCHGASAVPHPVGGTWVTTPPAAQPHGNDAKAAPGAAAGFNYCQACHGTGTDFAGGSSGVSCYTCHGASAPHPASWRTGDTYVHTSTAEGNASVCAFCHTDGANSPIPPPSPPAPGGTPPGCFNSTLCHATGVPHPVGGTWVIPGPSFHGLTAKADLAFCQTCHGTPGTILFDGGVAPTACSTCHSAAGAHPTTWYEAPQTGFPPYTPSHRNAGSITTACAICHVVDGPGTGPDPGAPSCFSASFTNAVGVAASCHASGPGAAPHPVPFLNHTSVTDATFNDPYPDGCASCHAVTGTSPVASAPPCSSCHTGGSPLTLLSCTSCHADPPAGAAYSNVAGAHAVHLGLDNTLTPVSCDTCHTGLGSTTQAHYDRAKAQVPPGDVVFVTTYDAQSGAPSFDNTLGSLDCSNVSCHGGQTTPNWQTGSIDVTSAADCLLCHAFGTAQYNSYNSGDHDVGAHVSFGCTACHNTTALSVNHFTALSTQAMEGPASATIGGTVTLPAGNYDPATGSCTPACHGTENW